MSRHLSVATIIDKNKIQAVDTYLVLIDAEIRDEYGVYVDNIRFVKNSENILFEGNTYQASNFDINITSQANQEPSITLVAQDQTRSLAQYIEAYGGLVDNKVTMTVINSAALTSPAEIQEEFKITGASVDNYVVTFQLGVDSAVSKRFPQYRQFKDRCGWLYKGNRCKYTGALPKCDYTLAGANGCIVHNNVANFGAFGGLNTAQ